MQATDRDRLGFDLGWDIARLGYGVLDYTTLSYSIRQGIAAGEIQFGRVKHLSCRYARKIVQIRLSAYRRGIPFSTTTVTAEFLKEIDVEFCPITRDRMTHGVGLETDWSVDRVDNSQGYVRGNLAVMSTGANSAKDSLDLSRLGDQASSCTLRPKSGYPLSPEAWQRLWTLASFTSPIPEKQIRDWPLIIFPPATIPLQKAWAFKFWMHCIACGMMPACSLAALIESKKELRTIGAFCSAMQDAGKRATASLKREYGLNDSDAHIWAMEDAWREPSVNWRYNRVTREISVGTEYRIGKYAERNWTQR